ncbi:hypothetical protein ACWEL8_28500 [Streptomyces sp. NPDC004690]
MTATPLRYAVDITPDDVNALTTDPRPPTDNPAPPSSVPHRW